MSGLFVKLGDQGFFRDFVVGHYRATPSIISDWLGCQNEIDVSRVDYAYGEYIQNVNRFAVLLKSENPDHYKRSGALLHALYKSNVVTSYDLTPGKFGSVDDLESGFTRVSHGDAEHVLTFVRFYEEFYNQLLAFELSFRCCSMYEKQQKTYSFDYLRNMCRYLKANTNLNVDSCFMVLKSLMH